MISLNKLVRTIVGAPTPVLQWLAGALWQGPLGYASGVGAGGIVTQLTSKVTAFTLNALTGQIVFAAGALAGFATSSSATWSNSFLTSQSVIVFLQNSGSIGSYEFNALCSAGQAQIVISNQSSASLNETPAVQFMVFSGSNT
jgi:hypothetical protein